MRSSPNKYSIYTEDMKKLVSVEVWPGVSLSVKPGDWLRESMTTFPWTSPDIMDYLLFNIEDSGAGEKNTAFTVVREIFAGVSYEHPHYGTVIDVPSVIWPLLNDNAKFVSYSEIYDTYDPADPLMPEFEWRYNAVLHVMICSEASEKGEPYIMSHKYDVQARSGALPFLPRLQELKDSFDVVSTKHKPRFSIKVFDIGQGVPTNFVYGSEV